MMVYRCLHVLSENGSRSALFLVAIAAAALLGACSDAAKEEPAGEAYRAVSDSSEVIDGEVDQELAITKVDVPIDPQNSAGTLVEEGVQASITDPRQIPVEAPPVSEVEEIVDAAEEPVEPVEPLPEAQVAQSVEVVENAEAEPDAAEVYYDDLAPYGEWLETDVYGSVWQPNSVVVNVSSDWRPYTDGAWVDSDEGWAWRSNEPFGEICYHYGRWVQLADCGWVWVPGFDWAPAWVAWRAADGIAGWAPLPPEYGISYVDKVGAVWNDGDRDYAPGPHCYNFVHLQDLTTGNCRSALLPVSRCASLFASTRSYTGLYRNEHQRICNSRLRDKFPAAQKLNLERHHSKPSSKKENARAYAGNSRSERGAGATRKLTAVRVDRGWERNQQIASVGPTPKRSSAGQRQRAASSPREVAVSTPDSAGQNNPRGTRQPDVESGTRTRPDAMSASRQRQQGRSGSGSGSGVQGSGSGVQGSGRQRQLAAQNQEERNQQEENARSRRAADIEEQQQRQRKEEYARRQRAAEDQEEETSKRQLQAQREEQQRQRNEENARRQRAAAEEESRKRQLQAQREEQQRQRNEENARRQRAAADEESQRRARQQQEAANARRSEERQRQEESARRERQQRQQEQQVREARKARDTSDRRRSEESSKQSESRSRSDSSPRSKR
jgi:hypothetical protein